MKTKLFSSALGLAIVSAILTLNQSSVIGQKKNPKASSAAAVAIPTNRRCMNWEERKSKFMRQEETNSALRRQGKPERRLTTQAMGNNPQEGQYRREMERLLALEISNINKAMVETQHKHKELIELYPKYKNYQQIVLKYTPGAYIDGVYVASRTTINLHYDDKGKINCLVLENKTRNIYNTNLWTNKFVRLYNPYIQFMELETFRKNYKLLSRLEDTSAAIQLKSLRLMYRNIRAAGYVMDVMIARYHHKTGKQADGQIN